MYVYIFIDEITFLLIKILHKVLNIIIADIVLDVCVYMYMCISYTKIITL